MNIEDIQDIIEVVSENLNDVTNMLWDFESAAGNAARRVEEIYSLLDDINMEEVEAELSKEDVDTLVEIAFQLDAASTTLSGLVKKYSEGS